MEKRYTRTTRSISMSRGDWEILDRLADDMTDECNKVTVSKIIQVSVKEYLDSIDI